MYLFHRSVQGRRLCDILSRSLVLGSENLASDQIAFFFGESCTLLLKSSLRPRVQDGDRWARKPIIF